MGISILRIWAIAANGFREVIRDRILYFIGFFALLMAFAWRLLPEIALFEPSGYITAANVLEFQEQLTNLVNQSGSFTSRLAKRVSVFNQLITSAIA